MTDNTLVTMTAHECFTATSVKEDKKGMFQTVHLICKENVLFLAFVHKTLRLLVL